MRSYQPQDLRERVALPQASTVEEERLVRQMVCRRLSGAERERVLTALFAPIGGTQSDVQATVSDRAKVRRQEARALAAEGLGHAEIAAQLGIGRSTVSMYLAGSR